MYIYLGTYKSWLVFMRQKGPALYYDLVNIICPSICLSVYLELAKSCLLNNLKRIRLRNTITGVLVVHDL